jgi:DNA-binding response OmpR family regulator
MTTPQNDRGKILLIDDEEGIGLAIKRMFRKRHDVTVKTSGEDGLRELEDDSRFDAIICDLMMPGMTGMDVYRKVEEHWPELADRFVFISGRIDSPDVKAFVGEVGRPILKKPMPPAELRSIVESIVSQSTP